MSREKKLERLATIMRDFDPNSAEDVATLADVAEEFDGDLNNVVGKALGDEYLLFAAAEKRCYKLVKYLVEECGVAIDEGLGHKGWTPLMIACRNYFDGILAQSPPGSGDDLDEYLTEYYNIVNSLLTRGANALQESDDEAATSAFTIACEDDPRNPLLELMVRREGKMKNGSAGIYPEIFLEFIRGEGGPNVNVIEYLLSEGSLSPNQICKTQLGRPSTALIEAIYSEDAGLVESFLRHGADVEQCQAPGNSSTSPLSIAMSLADPSSPDFDSSIIELLVQYGVIISPEDARCMRESLLIDLGPPAPAALNPAIVPVAAPMMMGDGRY